ncbi:phage baseplate assembly protein V [Caulobacter sp. SLTY]|uniref:phage baseplate assembly protein V n=1 Tax=Caulobacter sp. SLTY TaxID=2683262 RepID=UPI001411E499|nr:phage baseplate assembly protein V [Caulobacter sp. SLTY]NBB17559.1 phage baseplate assembly protein V [Caulobacter sp. SLTY]
MKRMADGLRMLAGWGAVSLVDDGEGGQLLQLEMLADEVQDDVQRHQDYGFSSHPLAGAEAVTVSLGGTRGRSLAVVVSDRRYRIDLAAGEVAIHDDLGQRVHLTRDGILIETEKQLSLHTGEKVVVNATGDVEVNTDGKAVVVAGGDATIDAGGNALVKAATKATVQAPQVIVDSADVRLGGAGATAKVALVGDAVSGGIITGPGATKVKAL